MTEETPATSRISWVPQDEDKSVHGSVWLLLSLLAVSGTTVLGRSVG
jgi:hypothetical protein